VLLIAPSAYAEHPAKKDPLQHFLQDVLTPKDMPRRGLTEEQRQKVAMLNKVSKDLNEIERALEKSRRSIQQMKDKIIFSG